MAAAGTAIFCRKILSIPEENGQCNKRDEGCFRKELIQKYDEQSGMTKMVEKRRNLQDFSRAKYAKDCRFQEGNRPSGLYFIEAKSTIERSINLWL